MSTKLISRSADLSRLKEEGYDVEIRSGYLLIKHVPYVNSQRHVLLGVLVTPLDMANDVTTRPRDHTVKFTGEYPCRADGSPIESIRNASAEETLLEGLVARHTFSNKPPNGYANFYEKMTMYVNILSGPAEKLEPTVTARVNLFVESADEDSVFKYMDTASSHSGTVVVNQKLELGKVAIIGLGGCGSYVLDLVAKTPTKEIHLFDGDRFLQHNAFRSPGAASSEELGPVPSKVAYYEKLYSNMRRGLVPHECYVDLSNVDELREMAFVFLALDRGASKKDIVAKLLEWQIPFVDVGMDVVISNERLAGMVSVTAATSYKHDHVQRSIPFVDADPNEDYSRNIQIADLNALSAALAVIKWKKLFGFYRDQMQEHQSIYTVDVNTLINEECYDTPSNHRA